MDDVRVDMFDEDDAKICDIVFSLGKLTEVWEDGRDNGECDKEIVGT